MRLSGAPEVGDLVVHTYDEERGITCLGFVLACRGGECQVYWPHYLGHNKSWHRRGILRVINENR